MSLKMDYPSPVKKGGKLFKLPNHRLLNPGPCNLSMEVLSAMLYQPMAPASKGCVKMNEEIQQMSKYVFQTQNPLTLVSQTSGNGGNEAMITNLADPGDIIVVATAGLWGAKVADMGRRYNLNVIELTKEAGEIYTFKELEEQIVKNKAVALFVTHGESSGGVLQPLDGLGDICHKYNCLLAVDAVVSLAVSPLFVDRWKIDAITGGSQKGLGAPAGLCLLSFSPLAHKRMLEKKHPPPYIFDMLSLADVWKCFGKPLKYHYTYGTPMLAALRQALDAICSEGLENCWIRHQKCAELYNTHIERLGLKNFVQKTENRFHGAVCTVLPNDVNWRLLMDFLEEKHEIEVGFGVGPTAGKALRIGFLGHNAKPEIVENFVEALEEGVKYCREYCRINGDPGITPLISV